MHESTAEDFVGPPKAHLAATRALIQCPQQVLEKQEVAGDLGEWRIGMAAGNPLRQVRRG